jgi:glutathione S-transferase
MASSGLLAASSTPGLRSGLSQVGALQSSHSSSFAKGLPLARESILKQKKGKATMDSARAEAKDSGVSVVEQSKVAKKKAKRFAIRGDKFGAVAGASLPLIMRLGTGALVSGYSPSLVKDSNPENTYSLFRVAGRRLAEKGSPRTLPPKPIEIYEFEGCPFCRKVREAVSYLDLDVLFLPTPKDGPTYRPKAIELGGKKQFPYMVDPNTGYSLYESDEIIDYLSRTYGDGKMAFQLKLGPLTTVTAGLAMLGRAGRGSSYRPAKKPAKPLELWAYEASPFCKIVREVLVELELPHIYHSCARGSPKRQELFERVGHFQAPYLEDPNTGAAMFESADIIDYLEKEYALVT